MANYYTQFVLTLPVAPAETKVQSEALMRTWVETVNQELEEAANSDDLKGISWWEENGQGVQLSFLERGGLVLLQDDCGEGNVTSAIYLTQRYLKTFGIKGGVLIAWASTCNKSRIDGFGGGGVVVTSEGELTSVNEYDAVVQAIENGVQVLNSSL